MSGDRGRWSLVTWGEMPGGAVEGGSTARVVGGYTMVIGSPEGDLEALEKLFLVVFRHRPGQVVALSGVPRRRAA
jgi:hypothetical protein